MPQGLGVYLPVNRSSTAASKPAQISSCDYVTSAANTVAEKAGLCSTSPEKGDFSFTGYTTRNNASIVDRGLDDLPVCTTSGPLPFGRNSITERHSQAPQQQFRRLPEAQAQAYFLQVKPIIFPSSCISKKIFNVAVR
ncbi:unnamed protein product [Protopolystoma xenopodis]|uniref:Uncharacterized protein n=1 Tax=Protopolystoma xenopodis TaxID=117903 RepID=A0A448X7T6_9PLAT|nr:unnamed protein product [Protopolystoma xenopodis]